MQEMRKPFPVITNDEAYSMPGLRTGGIDYEIGPDESLEDVLDTAELLQKIEGEEEVEKMDALLSLAITGGGL